MVDGMTASRKAREAAKTLAWRERRSLAMASTASQSAREIRRLAEEETRLAAMTHQAGPCVVAQDNLFFAEVGECRQPGDAPGTVAIFYRRRGARRLTVIRTVDATAGRCAVVAQSELTSATIAALGMATGDEFVNVSVTVLPQPTDEGFGYCAAAQQSDTLGPRGLSARTNRAIANAKASHVADWTTI